MVCGTEGVRNVWYASDCKHRSRCKHGGVKLQGGVGNLIRRKRREGGWEACVLVAEVVGSVPQALERHQRWYRSGGDTCTKNARAEGDLRLVNRAIVKRRRWAGVTEFILHRVGEKAAAGRETRRLAGGKRTF